MIGWISERTRFVPLVMVILGVLLGCLVGGGSGGGLFLLLTGEPGTLETPTPAPVYDIEVVVEERYLNRIVLENADDIASPLTAGTLDLRPGNMADFTAQLRVGPLRPVVDGTVGFRRTARGSVEVLPLDVRLGRLRLNRLVPDGILDSVNADIERRLVDRIGSQGLQVLSVQSDDETLRLRLGRSP